MAYYTWTIQDLQTLSATSLQLTYNTDAADTLSLMMRPENYAELPLQALDRLTVTDGERIVFSGLVPMGANCAAQAAAGETVDITLQSDYYVLDHTVYARLNAKGEAVFARTPVYSKTTTLSAVCGSVRNWLDDYLPSQLVCDVDASIPTPASNGTAPCSSLLHEGMRWVPDAVMVQRYGATENTLRLAKPEQLGEPLTLSQNTDPLQSVALQSREDLQVPVCALVGGVRRTWPKGADIRTLGAFVYAVPVDKDDELQKGGAGEAPASQKMVVKGVHLPDRVTYERGSEEYDADPITAMSNTAKFIKRIFPEYAPFINFMKVGSCLVNVVSREDFQDELEEDDEDAKLPANYNDDPGSWSADGTAVYVHTEGSFAASSRNSRNVRGLRWCKGTLSIVFAVQMNDTLIPRELWSAAELLFPGRRTTNKDNRYAYVRKTLSCNLINRRRKVFDPATNKLCSTDSDYGADSEETPEETPSMLDYVSAMGQYFSAANKLQHEGSISMLFDGQLNPAELTGRRVLVKNMRPEWEDMTAIIRSVQWDVGQSKLNITVGSRSVMGFDEYLERRLIARNRGRDKAQEEALAYDPEDEDAQKEQEADMSVSPSISAGTDTSSAGKWHKPFTLYTLEGDKDGKIMLAGGTLKRGTQTFNVEDSDRQILNGSPTGEEWEKNKKVKLRWKNEADGMVTYDIYQES